LEYGDMDELVARYADAVKDLPAIPSSSMTDPSSIITPRAAALESDFREKHI
jgi:anaerobic dimethyl sulfoxide reductase subunit B (iron-sulfur subunit)